MSRLPFEVFLALRYLRPKRTFVSVITLISVIGVTLGVAVLIIVISVMSGFDKQLRDKILGFNAHLRIMQWDSAGSGWPSPMAGWPKLLSAVSTNQSVKSVSPFVMGQVMVKTEPQTGNPLVSAPWIRGIDLQYETNLSVIKTNVIPSDFSLAGHNVLIGTEFADAMHLRLGDRLMVYSPSTLQRLESNAVARAKDGSGKERKEGEETIVPPDFTVSGIFDVGYYEYNANVILTSLENAQDLYELDDSVHGLMVTLKNADQAEAVRKQLYGEIGHNYRITTWMQENSSILNALMVEKNVMFYLLFFIMIVAAFGIMNSLITFVVQKTREIGVMKALGAGRRQVLWLFLGQSLVVGVVGVVIGFGLGMLALGYRNEFLHFMNRLTHLELFPAQIYGFTELPALIMPMDILIICGSALVICVGAGIIPALAAVRLNPVEALRHE